MYDFENISDLYIFVLKKNNLTNNLTRAIDINNLMINDKYKKIISLSLRLPVKLKLPTCR